MSFLCLFPLTPLMTMILVIKITSSQPIITKASCKARWQKGQLLSHNQHYRCNDTFRMGGSNCYLATSRWSQYRSHSLLVIMIYHVLSDATLYFHSSVSIVSLKTTTSPSNHVSAEMLLSSATGLRTNNQFALLIILMIANQ